MSSLCLTLYACGSDSDNDSPSKPCIASTCLNANALGVCDTTTGILHEENCPLGCDAITNRCKDAQTATQCTSDRCINSAILLVCNRDLGTTQQIQCPYGCDQSLNRCKDAETPNLCISDICQDDAFLLECNKQTGKTELKRCEYKCDKTANRCKDEPPKEKCTTDQCKDNTTLLVCNPSTGEYVESQCSEGCMNDRCVQKETCVPQCQSDNVAVICAEDGSSSTEKCTNGCDKQTGKCRPKSIIGESCKTEADPICEGNDFIYCAETSKGAVWTRMACPKNYECKVNDDQALCLERCSQKGEKYSICSSDFLVQSICSTLDGQLYYLPDYGTGILESCANGCADRHVCMEDSCDESYKETCTGNNHYNFCQYDTVVTGTCDVDKSCYMSSDNKAKCGYTCDSKNAQTHRCYYQNPDDPENSASSYAEVSCMKGDTGYGYEIITYTICSGKCSDTEGCL